MIDVAAKHTSKSLIFVGDTKCGKSSLAQKYLDTQLKEDVKETIAMEYHQGSKLNEQNAKVNINI